MSVVSWPKIVLFGDSQVERAFHPASPWAALLANRFQRVADVITRGFSEYNTRAALNILPRIFYPENISDIEAFVIFLSNNDSSGKTVCPEYFVTLEEYKENLEEMIKYLESIGLKKDKIILMTRGPFHTEKFLKWCEKIGRIFPQHGNLATTSTLINFFKEQGFDYVNALKETKKDENIPDYVEACLSVAQKHNLDAINVYEEIKKDKDWPRYLIDGFHLSSAGAKLIYNLLKPILEKKINASKMLMPDWQDINSVKPDDASKAVEASLSVLTLKSNICSVM